MRRVASFLFLVPELVGALLLLCAISLVLPFWLWCLPVGFALEHVAGNAWCMSGTGTAAWFGASDLLGALSFAVFAEVVS